MRAASVVLVVILVTACSSSGGTVKDAGAGGAGGGAGGSGGAAGGGGGGAGGGHDAASDTPADVAQPSDAADVAADTAHGGDGAADAPADVPPALGSPCNAGQTCGGPPLGCEYGISGSGACMHCGGPGEVCCNSTGLATGDCTEGRVCLPTVDTARHCSQTPADGGPG
jgi:hypothetical protein